MHYKNYCSNSVFIFICCFFYFERCCEIDIFQNGKCETFILKTKTFLTRKHVSAELLDTNKIFKTVLYIYEWCKYYFCVMSGISMRMIKRLFSSSVFYRFASSHMSRSNEIKRVSIEGNIGMFCLQFFFFFFFYTWFMFTLVM